MEKRPDLSIFLTERNRNFPLIAEAKLIDIPRGKTEKLYCEKGLMRFLNGEYAWGTTEAMMVAYVRDGSTLQSQLTPFLEQKSPCNAKKYLVKDMPNSASNMPDCVAISKHDRTFSYDVKAPVNDIPGPISLWH
ncbi:hypothetical protein [Roseibium sp. TrichSKD4]|uniref:hypothetical protein n=1 Tax=Roseibium sp. TrichSKD4 TaxID=744980 RepID=UPI00111271C8|nr:hypothetical protein [Roseibium sp. TrichSKD4]